MQAVRPKTMLIIVKFKVHVPQNDFLSTPSHQESHQEKS
jgi:hypothetical protein